MSNAVVCTDCKQVLPAISAHGLCPNCLLRMVSDVADTQSIDGETAADAPVTASHELELLGGYRIEREIGRGGMGRVFKAFDVRLGRMVALKTLASGQNASPTELERFKAEALAASRLQHPHIVSVHEVGVAAGTPFIAMALVEGPSLECKLTGGPLPPVEAAQIAQQLAAAIAYAHQQGVVHRDLKPSNILLDEWAGPKIADFGLGKQADSPDDLTMTGQIVGTPSYIAPEQISGKAVHHPEAIDVYGLGAVLYAIVTGRPPFQTDTALKALEQVQREDPASPRSLNPNIPRDLESICLKCLEKQPRRRYASAQALCDDLARFLDDRPIVARRVGPVGRTWRMCQRNPVAALLIGLLLLSMIAGATASLYFANQLRVATFHTKAAQTEARNELHKSLVMQARFGRLSRKPGQRNEGLKAIARAAEIKSTVEARNEAIACLTLVDVGKFESFELPTPRHVRIEANSKLTLLAYGSRTKGTDVVELNTGRCLQHFETTGNVALHMCFSRDSRLLIVFEEAARNKQKLLIYDIQGGQTIADFPSALHYSVDLDCGRIVSVDSNRTAEVTDLDAMKRTQSWQLSDNHNATQISQDGTRLASWKLGQPTVAIWNLVDGTSNLITTNGPVYRIAWSSDCKRILVAGLLKDSLINSASIWHVQTGRLVSILHGHSAEIRAVGFHKSDEIAWSYAWDGTTRLWNVHDGRELLRLPGRVVKWHDDGNRVILDTKHDIGELETGTSRAVRTIKADYDRHAVMPIEFSRDGRWLAAGIHRGIRLWDVESLQNQSLTPKTITLDTDSVESVAFSESGKMWSSGSVGIKQWRLTKDIDNSEQAERTIVGGSYELRMSASRDGSLIAARRGSTALLFDGTSGQLLQQFQGPPQMSRLDLSPDGKWLAVGCWTGNGITVWNTESDEQHMLLADTPNVLPRFSYDGKWLATGHSSAYHIWDTTSWQESLIIDRDGGMNANGVCDFSHDGRWVAVADTRTRAKLYRLADGQFVATLPVDARIHWCRFSPDDHLLAISCPEANGTIQLWDLEWIQQKLRPMQLDWDSDQ